MIFVRNQWLIDRGPAPGWGEEQLCIPTNKYTNVFLRARYADAHTECREQHYCSPILIMAKSWLETTRRTRDVLMIRDRGEVRVCGLNYRAAAFCMFPYRVYYGGAMNCELPLLVSAMATFLLPCSLFFKYRPTKPYTAMVQHMETQQECDGYKKTWRLRALLSYIK